MLRRTRLNKVSADLIEYLVVRKHFSQNKIAEMIGVDKSFVSRARRGERELSVTQMSNIADQLGVPLGAMLIDAMPPASKAPKENRPLIELCDRLMRQIDDVAEEFRQERSRRLRKSG
jgi:transcriptional regulator with XRE-family HTH domain